MNELLTPASGGGFYLRSIIAGVGIALVLLLTAYATLLVNANRLPRWLRLPLPASLRPRLTVSLVLVAILPALTLALVLAERAAGNLAARAQNALQTHAEMAAARLDARSIPAEATLDVLSQELERAARQGAAAREHMDDAGLGIDLLALVRADGTVAAVARGDGTPRSEDSTAELLAQRLPDTTGPLAIAIDTAGGGRTALLGAATEIDNGLRVVCFIAPATLRSARLQEYAVAAGWLLASLLASVCLAVGLAGSIAGPLRTLDGAVRNFDPEASLPPPAAPPGAPREVLVVFEHLATLGARLNDSYGQLRQSLRQAERLRSELIHVGETREQEIERRTEQLREANAQLDRLSRVDALTSVANRRGLSEFLERAWRGAQREQQPISVLMIDIDHFKAYNDSYGHQKGDTCIRAVADAISHIVSRATDIVARYGGEEFVAVLGNTPLEGALQVAEQLRAAIESLSIPHRGAPERGIVTVSIGVTSVLPVRGADADASLVAADRAMYAAKEQGRNRVGFSTAARTGLYQALSLPTPPSSTRPS